MYKLLATNSQSIGFKMTVYRGPKTWTMPFLISLGISYFDKMLGTYLYNCHCDLQMQRTMLFWLTTNRTNFAGNSIG
jgi:hypothetical protein